VRDIGIEVPSGHLVTGHIIATDPPGHSLLPKAAMFGADTESLTKGEVVIYRVIRGSRSSRTARERPLNLRWATSSPPARRRSASKAWGKYRVLRLGLLKGIESLRGWTPTQRDEIDGGRSDHYAQGCPPFRTEGKPVGYLYE
jgi:hypothetical protein